MTTTKYVVHGFNCLTRKRGQQTYRSLESARKNAREWLEGCKDFCESEGIQFFESDFWIEKVTIETIDW